MMSNAAEDVGAGAGGALRNELAKMSASEAERTARRVSAPAAGSAAEPPVRLPRPITGGFRGIGDDLDRHARDWRNMVRLLEQQRPQLETAEAERDRLYEAFGRIVPEVQESGRALKALIEAAKAGDASGDLMAQFTQNLNALDELESIAEALASNLLWVRSTWEQYARSILQAQKMREDLMQGENGH